jgi:transposase
MPPLELHRENGGFTGGGVETLVSVDGHRDLPPTEEAQLAAELTGLRRRLETQTVIEQSKGLLMGYYGIDADTAFALLKRWSQSSNTKLREINYEISSILVNAATSQTAVPAAQNRILRQTIQRLQRSCKSDRMGSSQSA